MKRFIPLFFIFAILVSVLLSFLFVQPKTISLEYDVDDAICGEGEKKACTSDACTGTSTCLRGRWGVCKLDIICVPGDTMPCVEGGPCACGYRICNECGTAYGECLGNKTCG